MRIQSLKSLTSLRFFAALLVVLSHFNFLKEDENLKPVFDSIFSEGYVGVTFFFILSGFILSHAYRGSIERDDISNLEFWLARIARIYPLHILTLLFALPLEVRPPAGLDLGFFFSSLAAQISLTQSFLSWTAFSFNSPAWSLSAEVFFYLLFPFLVIFSTSRLLKLVVVSFACHLVVGISQLYGHLPQMDVHFLLFIFPLGRLVDFAVGLLIYRAYERLTPPSPFKASLLQFAALVAFAVSYLLGQRAPAFLRYDLLYVLPMSFLIITFAWQKGLIARWLSRPSLVLLGNASFSLYLIHHLVIKYGQLSRKKFEFLESELAAATFYLLTSVILALILYRWFCLQRRLCSEFLITIR